MHQLSKIVTMGQDGDKWYMVALDNNCQTNQYLLESFPKFKYVECNSEIQNGIRHIVLVHYTLLERILKYYFQWKNCRWTNTFVLVTYILNENR